MTIYSDHFSAGGDADTFPNALRVGRSNAPRGAGGTSRKVKRAYVDGTAATTGSFVNGEDIAFCTMRSNARIYELFLTVTNAWNTATTLTMDIGVYEMDADDDIGAAVDADLFDVARNIDATAVAYVDVFDASDLADIDRGKYLWELCVVGDATWTEDPNEQFIIAGNLNVAGAVTAGGEMFVEVHYSDA